MASLDLVGVAERSAVEAVRVALELKRCIKAHGQSVRSVERRLGWGNATLADKLKGRNRLDIETIAAVAEACGFDVRDFYRRAAGKDDREKTEPRTPPEGLSKEEIDATTEDAMKLVKRWREGKGQSK